MLSCSGEGREPVCLMPDTTVVRAGDIVFRRGGGFTSHAVVTLDARGYYSHVGMVVDTAGRMMVVHAVPGEPDYEGDPDRVKLDSLICHADKTSSRGIRLKAALSAA